MLKFLMVVYTMHWFIIKKNLFFGINQSFLIKIFYFNISKKNIYLFKLNQFFFKTPISEVKKNNNLQELNLQPEIVNIFSFDTLCSVDVFYPNFFWQYFLVKMQINLFYWLPTNLILKKKFFKISNYKLLGVFNSFNRLEFILSLVWQIKSNKIQLHYLKKQLILINNKYVTNKDYFIKKNDTLIFLKNPINNTKFSVWSKFTQKNSILFVKKDWEINYLTQTLTKLNSNHYYLLHSYVSILIRLFNWRTYVWKSSKTFLQK